MARRLPPLNGLRALEAAARRLSFTRAAEELSVTPAAISHQIRELEARLETPLFRRARHGLEPTEPLRLALPLLRDGFDRLEEAAARLRAGPRSLTVSAAPSFAAKWLVPRLERFNAVHPGLDLRLQASHELASFAGDGVDVALRYGAGRYPGLVVRRLMGEAMFPVCAPALLERAAPLRAPVDLARHTLLHVDWRGESEFTPSWRMWLRAAGVEGVDPEPGPRFDMESLALEAAAGGQGVALASGAVVAGDLASGRLVRAFPALGGRESAFCYWVVHPPRKAEDPAVAAFVAWALEQAETDGAG